MPDPIAAAAVARTRSIHPLTEPSTVIKATAETGFVKFNLSFFPTL